jgi:hypothetical protein
VFTHDSIPSKIRKIPPDQSGERQTGIRIVWLEISDFCLRDARGISTGAGRQRNDIKKGRDSAALCPLRLEVLPWLLVIPPDLDPPPDGAAFDFG